MSRLAIVEHTARGVTPGQAVGRPLVSSPPPASLIQRRVSSARGA